MRFINLFLAIPVLLAGCATTQDLYSWGDYEAQVYSQLKGESPEQQIIALEKHLAEIKNKNQKPPPGFYAHLGLLYEKAGRTTEVAMMFEEEKLIYPESSTFLNNLISGFKTIK